MRRTINLTVCILISAIALHYREPQKRTASITICDSGYVATDTSQQQPLASAKTPHEVAVALASMCVCHAQCHCTGHETEVSDLVRALAEVGITTTLLISTP